MADSIERLKKLLDDFYGGRFDVAGMTHVVVSIPSRMFEAENRLRRLENRLTAIEGVNFETLTSTPSLFAAEWQQEFDQRLRALEKPKKKNK